MSKREALIDIISMAQQARPKLMGQMEFLRAQLTALSSVVSTMPSECGGRGVGHRIVVDAREQLRRTAG